jgi:hypothetical protein
MSAVLLFGMGMLVTLLVSIGLALPIYGAILDGRDQRRFEEAQRRASRDEEKGRLHAIDAA